MPQDIRQNVPASPRVYFPGKKDYSFDASEDIDEVVYNKAAAEYYKIMGYGAYFPRAGGVWLYDGHEVLSTAGKDIIQRLTDFCAEKGGYELYCCERKIYQDGYNISSSGSAWSLNNTTYSDSETTVSQNYKRQFVYYIISPFSKDEIASWKLGMEVRNILATERNELKRNTGVIVTMVYEKYPGFRANLNRGDIISVKAKYRAQEPCVGGYAA